MGKDIQKLLENPQNFSDFKQTKQTMDPNIFVNAPVKKEIGILPINLIIEKMHNEFRILTAIASGILQ